MQKLGLSARIVAPVLLGLISGSAFALITPAERGTAIGIACTAVGTYNGCVSCVDHRCQMVYPVGFPSTDYYTCQGTGRDECIGLP